MESRDRHADGDLKSLCNKVVLQFVTLKFKHVLAICSPLKSNFMSVIDIMSGDLNFFFSF